MRFEKISGDKLFDMALDCGGEYGLYAEMKIGLKGWCDAFDIDIDEVRTSTPDGERLAKPGEVEVDKDGRILCIILWSEDSLCIMSVESDEYFDLRCTERVARCILADMVPVIDEVERDLVVQYGFEA